MLLTRDLKKYRPLSEATHELTRNHNRETNTELAYHLSSHRATLKHPDFGHGLPSKIFKGISYVEPN